MACSVTSFRFAVRSSGIYSAARNQNGMEYHIHQALLHSPFIHRVANFQDADFIFVANYASYQWAERCFGGSALCQSKRLDGWRETTGKLWAKVRILRI